MTPTHLDPYTAARLAKLCGMFGSLHAGERATAAVMADALRRQHGLTWQQIIFERQGDGDTSDKLAFLVENQDLFDDWQRKFVRNVSRFKKLSEKQIEKIAEIFEQVVE
jgi:hypothetical protein